MVGLVRRSGQTSGAGVGAGLIRPAEEGPSPQPQKSVMFLVRLISAVKGIFNSSRSSRPDAVRPNTGFHRGWPKHSKVG